jgi:organic radical activating enzyme
VKRALPDRVLAWVARRRSHPVITAQNKLRIRSLEFFLINTCNLRCRYCAASSPFLSQRDLPDLDGFRHDLTTLATVMECGQLKLLGGEPLLNRHIADYLMAARQSGMFRQLRVTTNGLLLHKMSEAFWQAVDIVEISLYPASRSVVTEKRLADLERTALRFGTRLEVQPITRFRESVRDTPAPNSLVVKETFSACAEAHEWSNHLLYRHRLYRCSRVHTIDRYLTETGVIHDAFTELDGMPVDHRPTLRDDLFAYLTSRVPLRTCCFCHGTSGPEFLSTQLTMEEIRSRRSMVLDIANDRPSS